MNDNANPTVSVLYRRALQIGGDFATIELGVQLPAEASDEAIAQAMGTSERAFAALREQMKVRVLEIRKPKAKPAPAPSGNGNGLTLELALAAKMPVGTKSKPGIKGKTLAWVENNEPDLIDWLVQNSEVPGLRAAAALIQASRTVKGNGKPGAPSGNGQMTPAEARALRVPFKIKGFDAGVTFGDVEKATPGTINALAKHPDENVRAAVGAIIAGRSNPSDRPASGPEKANA
jgi:hypothetical protein